MSSLYQSMVAVIEQSITPLAAKLGQQKYVIAIQHVTLILLNTQDL